MSKENLNNLLSLKLKHPFHLVKPSAWPFFLSVNLLYFILVFVTFGIKHGHLSSTNVGKYHSKNHGTADLIDISFIDSILLSFVKCTF